VQQSYEFKFGQDEKNKSEMELSYDTGGLLHKNTVKRIRYNKTLSEIMTAHNDGTCRQCYTIYNNDYRRTAAW